MLNAIRCHLCPRRHETTKLSSATVIVAGAGPNNMADVIKNVSVTEIVADTDAIFMVNVPASRAIAAKRSHAKGCGVCGSVRNEWPRIAIPAATTSRMNTLRGGDTSSERAAVRSSGALWPSAIGLVRVWRRQDGVAPQNLVIVDVLRVAPQNLLSLGVVDLIAPENLVARGPVGHLTPDQAVRFNRCERVQQADEIQITPFEE